MFEYDPAKSTANLAKHGIDFETAQTLWDDPNAIETATGFLPESRSLLIGVHAEKHWTVVFTLRERNIRIISARRSRRIEAETYEAQRNQR